VLPAPRGSPAPPPAPPASSSSGGGSGGGGKPGPRRGTSSGGGAAGKSPPPPVPSVAQKIGEEVWVSTGSVMLLAAGWSVLASLPAERACGVFDDAGCLRGWPVIPVEPRVLAYYNAELGWYGHLMLKHALGLGLDDGSAMHWHHVATVALVVTSYLLGVQNMGMLVFCLLNVSSPFLHASKLGNMLEMRRARVWLFLAFAAAYFVARLLLFPYVVVKVAVLGALEHVPSLIQHFLGYWLMFNVLLLALCALQGLWFVAIVRILRTAFVGGKAGSGKAAGGSGAHADAAAAADEVAAAGAAARDLAARGLLRSGGGGDRRRQQPPQAGGGGLSSCGSLAERGAAGGLLAPASAAAATVELPPSAAGLGGGGGGFAAAGGGGGGRGGDDGRKGGGRPGEAAADQASDASGFAGAAKHLIGRLVRFSSGGGGRGVVGTGPSQAERMAAATAASRYGGGGGGASGYGNGNGNGGGKPAASAFERQPLLSLATGPSLDLESQRPRRPVRAAREAADAGGGDTAGAAGGAALLASAPSVGTGRAASLSGGAAGRRPAAAAAMAADALQPQPSATTQQVYVR